jgi:hypothetical protein
MYIGHVFFVVVCIQYNISWVNVSLESPEEILQASIERRGMRWHTRRGGMGGELKNYLKVGLPSSEVGLLGTLFLYKKTALRGILVIDQVLPGVRFVSDSGVD